MGLEVVAAKMEAEGGWLEAAGGAPGVATEVEHWAARLAVLRAVDWVVDRRVGTGEVAEAATAVGAREASEGAATEVSRVAEMVAAVRVAMEAPRVAAEQSEVWEEV